MRFPGLVISAVALSFALAITFAVRARVGIGSRLVLVRVLVVVVRSFAIIRMSALVVRDRYQDIGGRFVARGINAFHRNGIGPAMTLALTLGSELQAQGSCKNPI